MVNKRVVEGLGDGMLQQRGKYPYMCAETAAPVTDGRRAGW